MCSKESSIPSWLAGFAVHTWPMVLPSGVTLYIIDVNGLLWPVDHFYGEFDDEERDDPITASWTYQEMPQSGPPGTAALGRRGEKVWHDPIVAIGDAGPVRLE